MCDSTVFRVVGVANPCLQCDHLSSHTVQRDFVVCRILVFSVPPCLLVCVALHCQTAVLHASSLHTVAHTVPALAGVVGAALGRSLVWVASQSDANAVLWAPQDPAAIALAISPPAPVVEVDPKAKGKAPAKPAPAKKAAAPAAGKGKGVEAPVVPPPSAPEGLPLQAPAVPHGLHPSAAAVMQQVCVVRVRE